MDMAFYIGGDSIPLISLEKINPMISGRETRGTRETTKGDI